MVENDNEITYTNDTDELLVCNSLIVFLQNELGKLEFSYNFLKETSLSFFEKIYILLFCIGFCSVIPAALALTGNLTLHEIIGGFVASGICGSALASLVLWSDAKNKRKVLGMANMIGFLKNRIQLEEEKRKLLEHTMINSDLISQSLDVDCEKQFSGVVRKLEIYGMCGSNAKRFERYRLKGNLNAKLVKKGYSEDEIAFVEEIVENQKVLSLLKMRK